MSVDDEPLAAPTLVAEPVETRRSRPSLDDLRERLREVARFLVVGGVAFVVDLGLFNLLMYGPGHVLGHKPLTSKVISVVAATLVSWVGNRLWTFSAHRTDRHVRELVLYGVINAVGALLPVATLALSRYALHQAGPLEDNVATVVGIAIATVFRYVGYKLWVFTGTPDTEAAPAVKPASQPVS